ncbi:hypothetical protein [Undibacterium pigrum]|uniref:hypothetical protein n=1 Tax=Undibacterium pigrum TaxID=401470 RepID=UPI0011B72331|nr:hypothetical protein [Undibacterium pigrum]
MQNNWHLLEKSCSIKGKANDKVRNILEFFSVARAFYWYARPLKVRWERNYLHLCRPADLLIFCAENYTCLAWQLTKFCSHFSQFPHGKIVLLANDSLAKIASGLMRGARKNIFKIVW